MLRRVAALPLLAAVSCFVSAIGGTAPLASGAAGALAGAVARTGTGYVAPLAGAVVVLRPFEPPPGPYAAGHRGVDLAAEGGAVVRAAQAGRIRFAGQVAGRGVLVIEHGDGIRTEYEPVTAAVATGAVVVRGQRLGSVSGLHGRCPPGGCLHWGARRGGRYFDPMTLLAPLGVVRLVPWTDPAQKPISIRTFPLSLRAWTIGLFSQ